jgi:aminoglycoside phosphotransferase (APT) family kinase protein
MMEPYVPERRHPVIALDAAAIAAALAPLAGAGDVRAVALLSGGFSNTNYRVDLAARDDPVVLRLYGGGDEVCRKETALLARLAGSVPVPEVLHAAPEGGSVGVPYAVLAWVDGVPMEAILRAGDARTIFSCAAAAGYTLAALGTMTFPTAGFFSVDLAVTQPLGAEYSWSGYLTACLETPGAAQRLGMDLARRLTRLVARYAAEMHAPPEVAALVHADYQGKNLLMRPVGTAWQVAAVLDWEFAFAGTPIFDLGILLRYADALPEGYAEAVARGYTAGGGSLPADWPRLARLNDLVNLCEFLQKPTPRPALEAEMRRLIAATVNRYLAAEEG